MAIIGQDNFNRADNATSWGTASDGKTYTISGTGVPSILSNQGMLKSDAVDTLVRHGSYTSSDFDVTVKVTINDPADIGCVAVRYAATNDQCYKLCYYGAGLHLNKRLATGSNVELVTAAFTMTPGTQYYFRLQAIGTALNGKVWPVSGSEPASWTLQTTDTDLTSGGVGLIANTAGPGSVLFDDLSVDDTTTGGGSGGTPTTSATILGRDSFFRADQSGWNPATDGQNWTITSGTGVLSIVSNQGQVTGSTVQNFIQLGSKVSSDSNTVVTLKFDNTAMTSTGIVARQTAATTLYRARLNSGNNTLAIVKTIAGTSTDITSASFTLAINTAYKLRFKIIKDRLYAKVWAASSSEPLDWTAKGTDTAITGAGGVGITSFCSSSTGKAWYTDFYSIDYEPGSFNKLQASDRSKQAGKNKGTDKLTALTSGSATAHSSDTSIKAIERLTALTTYKLLTQTRGSKLDTLTDRGRDKGKQTGRETLTALTSGDTTPTYVDHIQLHAQDRSREQGHIRGTSSLTVIVRGGVLAKPVVLPDGVSVWIAGEQIRYREASLSINGATKQHDTCSFTVYDPTGTKRYAKGFKVEIKHNVLGTIFAGVINDATESNLYPNDDNNIKIRCIDNSWYTMKRIAKRDYSNQYAGFILTDLLGSINDEGITANYAIRRDLDQDDFNQGALSNVVATPDGLQLAPSGTRYEKTEASTGDFNTGTLDDLQAANNALQITPLTALRLRGTAASSISDCYSYRKIWGGSSITINSGDVLFYNIWISSTSPESKAGVQLYFSDGTNFNNTSVAADQFNIFATPQSDLSSFAQDQWMDRYIDLSGFAGKTLKAVAVALEGNQSGTYNIYFRNVQLYTSAFVLRTNFFAGSRQMDLQVNNVGYKDVTTAVVPVSSRDGFRLSPAYDISSVGIVRSSNISWVATTQQQEQSANNTNPQVKISTSIDQGATWQVCTNHNQIPNLLPGMNAQTLTIREDLNVGGPNPELTPFLQELTFSIEPSFATTKQDARFTNKTTADFSTGTSSNLAAVSNTLALNGKFRDWDDGGFNNGQTLYGQGNPAHFASYGSLALRCDNVAEVRSRFDFAGNTWQNFILEIDIQMVDTNDGNYGVVYRTTGWNNTNDTYAYNAFITPTAVTLARGTNGGSGGFTQIASVAVSFSANAWYRMKLTVNGSNHRVAIDDVEYINTTDGTYSAAGYVGVRHFNNTGGRHSAFFDNFGVMSALSGTRTVTALTNAQLSPVGTVGTSIVAWDADTHSNDSLLVDASTDNGTTWGACTNGGAIPGLEAGTLIGSKSLQLRQTFAASNANTTPVLRGLTAQVIGAFSASGSRVSPVLNLDTAGIAGSSVIACSSDVPTGTALHIDAAPDTSAWTEVTSGDAIPFLTHQTSPFIDPYDSDTSSGYTLLTRSGGQQAVPTWDTTNGRLIIIGGREGLLRADSVDFKDGEVWFDTNQSDQGGIVLRCQNADNYYDVAVYDAVSSVQTNIIQLYRVAAGTRDLLTVGPIDFPRGTPKRIKVTIVDDKITVYFDGMVVIDYEDTTPLLSSGKTGFRAGYTQVAGTSYYQSLRIQGYGEKLAGKTVYSRLRFSSTDPRYTPIVPDLMVLCNHPNIAVGSLIKEATYAYDKTVAEAIDDIASKSGCIASIAPDNELTFLAPENKPAPWIASTATSDLLLGIEVENSGDTYRNWQFVKGVIDLQTIPEKKQGDGKTTSWVLGYPVNEAPAILLNGVAASVGLKGETGKDFYYEVGDTTIAQDESASPVAEEVEIAITYVAQVRKTVEAKDDTEIAARQAIEGGSGIVENVFDATDQNLSLEAGQQLAQSLLDENKKIGRTVRFGTLKHGLAPGQLLSLSLPEHGIQDGLFLITSVNTAIDTRSRESIAVHQSIYDIECTDGPDIGNWIHLYRKK